MDYNATGSILCSFKWHHDIGARPDTPKSIEKILRGKIGNYWQCGVRFKFHFVCIVRNLLNLFGSVLFAVGNGLMWPSIMSILSKRAGTAYQGAVQGVAGSVTGVGLVSLG